MALLKVSGLTKNFGGLCAVSNVNMEINEQELIGLIGPNGAGKTTLFNLLTGVYEPSEGKIELNVDGAMKEIGGMKPYAVTRMGLARTFQNIRLFKNLTALDNVKIAMHKNIKYGTLQAILRTPNYYREEERVEQQAEELLEDAESDALFQVLLIAGKAAGFISVTRLLDEVGGIGYIGVHPDVQGRQYGTVLLKKAMDMAWRHNIHKLIGDIDVHNFAIRENLLRTGFLLDCGQSIFLLEKQI